MSENMYRFFDCELCGVVWSQWVIWGEHFQVSPKSIPNIEAFRIFPHFYPNDENLRQNITEIGQTLKLRDEN